MNVSSGSSATGASRRHALANTAWKYALAIVSVAVALFITQSLQPTIFPTPLFFAAIVISTWRGGAGPGLCAVLLATLLLEYFFIPQDGGVSADTPDVFYLAQFSLPALLTCWFVKKRKEAEAALKDARDHLDAKVQQRTTELQQANEKLHAEIAERLRTEEAFQRTQADLAHLTRVSTLSALATSIAHEVNQPLAAIVTTGDACLRWLSAEPPNLDRVRDSVSRIIGEGTRAGEVIRRIRDLSTKSTRDRSLLQINELIHDVTSLLKPELTRHRVDLTEELHADCPLVHGDRIQLQQVILNLMVNGIESMSDVTARPRTLSVRSRAVGRDRVEVSVRDCGKGFDPAHAARLFETFFTTKPDGIGMGLSISRTIIESHGGKLSGGTNPDHGATFQFELPVAGGNDS